MFGKDIVTGHGNIRPGYHTTGPADSRVWQNKMPSPILNVCMLEGEFLPSKNFTGPEW
jgi:hypothetical protein